MLELTPLDTVIKASSMYLHPLEDDSFWIDYLQQLPPLSPDPPSEPLHPPIGDDSATPIPKATFPSPSPVEGYAVTSAKGMLERSLDISNYLVETALRLEDLREKFPTLDTLHSVGATPEEAADFEGLPQSTLSSFVSAVLSRPSTDKAGKAIDLTRDRIFHLLRRGATESLRKVTKGLPGSVKLAQKLHPAPREKSKKLPRKERDRQKILTDYYRTHAPEASIFSPEDAPTLAREAYILHGLAGYPDIYGETTPFRVKEASLYTLIKEAAPCSTRTEDYASPRRPLTHRPHWIADNFAWLTAPRASEWSLSELYTLVTVPSPFCLIKDCLQIEIVRNRFESGAVIVPFGPPLIATCNRPSCPSYHMQNIDALKAVEFINYGNTMQKLASIRFQTEQTLNFMGFASLLYEFSSYLAGRTLAELILKDNPTLKGPPPCQENMPKNHFTF